MLMCMVCRLVLEAWLVQVHQSCLKDLVCSGLCFSIVKLMLSHFLDKFNEWNDITKCHIHGDILGFGHGKHDL